MLEKIVGNVIKNKFVQSALAAAAFAFLAFQGPQTPAYETVPNGQSAEVTAITPKQARKICHRDLSFEIIELYRQNNKGTQTDKDLTQNNILLAAVQGSVDEDGGCALGFAPDVSVTMDHFFNPTAEEGKRGLVYPTEQKWRDVLTAIERKTGKQLTNDGSRDALTRATEMWNLAVETYAKAKTEEEIAKAYHILHHAMHLFQDDSVVEHVLLIDHGPRIRKVTLDDGEVCTPLGVYEANNAFVSSIITRIQEKFDTDKCEFVSIGSRYEEFCANRSIAEILRGRKLEIRRTKSLDSAFIEMARRITEPDRAIRQAIKERFRKGSYVNENNADAVPATIDYETIASHLVPINIEMGAGLLELWNKSIEAPKHDAEIKEGTKLKTDELKTDNTALSRIFREGGIEPNYTGTPFFYVSSIISNSNTPSLGHIYDILLLHNHDGSYTIVGELNELALSNDGTLALILQKYEPITDTERDRYKEWIKTDEITFRRLETPRLKMIDTKSLETTEINPDDLLKEYRDPHIYFTRFSPDKEHAVVFVADGMGPEVNIKAAIIYVEKKEISKVDTHLADYCWYSDSRLIVRDKEGKVSFADLEGKILAEIKELTVFFTAEDTLTMLMGTIDNKVYFSKERPRSKRDPRKYTGTDFYFFDTSSGKITKIGENYGTRHIPTAKRLDKMPK